MSFLVPVVGRCPCLVVAMLPIRFSLYLVVIQSIYKFSKVSLYTMKYAYSFLIVDCNVVL